MKKVNIKDCGSLYVISVFILISFFFPKVSVADVTAPWAFSFDCGREYTLNQNLMDWYELSKCESGVGPNLNAYSSDGYYQEIVNVANNPLGLGAGSRQWMGAGKNDNSGGFSVTFDHRLTEFWLRWYFRWEKGFYWGYRAQKKLLYFDMLLGSSGSWQPKLSHYDTFGFYIYKDSTYVPAQGTGFGWDDLMVNGADSPAGDGHKASDGRWHYMEIHVKYESKLGVADGIAEMWIDSNQIVSSNKVEFGSTSGALEFQAPSNQDSPAVLSNMYLDYDDFALSTTGPIGPLGGGAQAPPIDTTPPLVNMTNPTQGQTISGVATISANAQDDVAIADVQFQIDGFNSGSKVFQAPFQFNLDTLNLLDGSHSADVIATDTSGNQTTSSSINFTVDNSGAGSGTVLFTENFEDTSLSARGWYDNTSVTLSSTEYAPVSGSTKSAEFHFAQGATSPGGGSMRRKFTASEDITVEFWVMYSSNWQGSGKAYHPHEILISSDMDSDYSALANNYLQLYIEEGALTPRLAIQDSLNTNESYGTPPNDLTSTTEDRSVAACNSLVPLATTNTCYGTTNDYYSASTFDHSSAAITAGIWHKVKVRFKMNSILAGVGQSDGIMQYWLDDVLLIDHQAILYRTGNHPNKKLSQFVIAPYIGDGSPVDQTMWIDNLTVAVSSPVTTLQAPAQFQLIP